MAEASGIIAAGPHAGAGVHPELKSLGMDIVADGFHALRKLFRVGNYLIRLGISFFFAPAVVNDKICISGVAQSEIDHGVRGFLYHIRVKQF